MSEHQTYGQREMSDTSNRARSAQAPDGTEHHMWKETLHRHVREYAAANTSARALDFGRVQCRMIIFESATPQVRASCGRGTPADRDCVTLRYALISIGRANASIGGFVGYDPLPTARGRTGPPG